MKLSRVITMPEDKFIYKFIELRQEYSAEDTIKELVKHFRTDEYNVLLRMKDLKII